MSNTLRYTCDRFTAVRVGQRWQDYGQGTLLHLVSPCFTLLQPERNSGIRLTTSFYGAWLMGDDQRVRLVPRSGVGYLEWAYASGLKELIIPCFTILLTCCRIYKYP